MQPLFGLTLFLNEEAFLPVTLQNATGGDLAGYVASSVDVSTSQNGAALTAFSAAARAAATARS